MKKNMVKKILKNFTLNILKMKLKKKAHVGKWMKPQEECGEDSLSSGTILGRKTLGGDHDPFSHHRLTHSITTGWKPVVIEIEYLKEAIKIDKLLEKNIKIDKLLKWIRF